MRGNKGLYLRAKSREDSKRAERKVFKDNKERKELKEKKKREERKKREEMEEGGGIERTR